MGCWWNTLMNYLNIRFCSQPFKIEDFHESIHLCNNAIQQKYKNCDRSSSLPEKNMWDNETFINYLRQVGLQDSWQNIIYPGMKKCLIGSLLATQGNKILTYFQNFCKQFSLNNFIHFNYGCPFRHDGWLLCKEKLFRAVRSRLYADK